MIYTGEKLREISFPLGGIGSGCIGLRGNGRLADWEIFNRPSKGSINGYSHFAIRAKLSNGTMITRVLNGDIDKDLCGQYTKISNGGYGIGLDSKTMAGFPHFRGCEFKGEFPIAEITLSDDSFPGKITLTAFNPLIPLNSADSSIPAAFFEIAVENTTGEDIEYTFAASLANPFEGSVNEDASCDAYKAVRLTSGTLDKADVHYGDMTLACCDSDAVVQRYWYRGGWQDSIVTYWHELNSADGFRDRVYSDAGRKDHCTIASTKSAASGDFAASRFIISWNVPNCRNYWQNVKDADGNEVTWKNYYATVFEDSAASAAYSIANWDRLYGDTAKFRDALHSSTLDSAVIDAASSTLSVIKSPTALRLEDGSFWGWEGTHEEAGSCEGTCQHVWNYAYAMCFLFPDLERSIRELEFKYNTRPNGHMDFRLGIPFGYRKPRNLACVDGQMGAVIKTYREWKLSGDDEWLRSHWDTLKSVISYAWNPENPHEWDLDKDGVLEGRQHHTLDMELFGPSSWLEGFYLAALKCGAEMARYLGDDTAAAEYTELYEKGYKWTYDNLFNGNYYIQKTDLGDKARLEHFGALNYWNEESGEYKYQIADGCIIDQMLAQWHADICGIGDIFDREQRRTALRNLYANNYKQSMRDFTNPWRIFSLNDESAAIICDYPEGTYKPVIPIPYCEETMHGFEYSLAGLLIAEGFVDEGLSIVSSVRDRYDGMKRNPYNEIECGSNYARSMASFALLPIFSGFEFDLPHGYIGFNPITSGDFNCLWSVANAWGNYTRTNGKTVIEICGGELALDRLGLKYLDSVKSVTVDGRTTSFEFADGIVSFGHINARKSIVIE